MKNLQSTQSSARFAAHQSFDRRDFRQDFTSLYMPPLPPLTSPRRATLANVQPTDEFPLLADPVCKRLIAAATLERLEHMNIDPEGSTVDFQGWVERYARCAGVKGWTVPAGMVARWGLRARCLVRVMSVTADETLP